MPGSLTAPRLGLHWSVLRAVLGAAGLFGLTVGTTLATAPSAYADESDSVSCTGTNQDSYAPGITLAPRVVDAHWRDTYSTCTSSDPTLTAGSDSVQATEPLSCAEPFQLFPGPITVKWNNKTSSTLLLTSAQTQPGSNAVTVALGTVTAGQFEGDSVVAQWVDAQPDPVQCLTPEGVTSQSGSSSLQIIGN